MICMLKVKKCNVSHQCYILYYITFFFCKCVSFNAIKRKRVMITNYVEELQFRYNFSSESISDIYGAFLAFGWWGIRV